jgi:ATP-dependent 26S proteasome regulatory subunit
MVVLEDIDLIAQERTHPGAATPLLFELLNQIDGLGEDADVVFLLTTNRPDLLEPALAARPGRVDQAIELPFPDAVSRRRLLDLYARGLDMETGGFDAIVERTDGASAALIKELLRRAAVRAGERSVDGIRVRGEDLAATLDELLEGRSRLTSVLFGSQPSGSS